MCRFAAYLGRPIVLDDILYRTDHSVIDLAKNPVEGPLNGDGYGVGWYAHDTGPNPAHYRTAAPAWTDYNMKRIAPRVESSLFFAHVRGATEGMAVQETNCHPFTHGRLLFMHNGQVEGHDTVARSLRDELPDTIYHRIEGTTDSEHLFALVQDELGENVEEPTTTELAQAAANSIRRVEKIKDDHGVGDTTTRANIAVTDGRSIVAVRYATNTDRPPSTLHISRGDRIERDDEGVRVVDPEGDGAVLISSDPMIERDGSRELIPQNHVVTVRPDRSVEIEPFSAA